MRTAMKTTYVWLETLWKLSFLIHLVDSVVPELHRTIEKSGFHREIVTQLELPVANLPLDLLHYNIQCQAMFTETIPSGAYVDPYQLDSLKAFGGPDVLVSDKIDIEAPEYLSEPHAVRVYTDLWLSEPHWTCNYSLPIHLRYHAVSETNDFAEITFTSPETALKFVDTDSRVSLHLYTGGSHRQLEAPCDSRNQRLCDWTVIMYQHEDAVLNVEVPVGRSGHYMLVLVGTTFTTVAGCLLLTYKVITTNTKVKVS